MASEIRAGANQFVFISKTKGLEHHGHNFRKIHQVRVTHSNGSITELELYNKKGVKLHTFSLKGHYVQLVANEPRAGDKNVRSITYKGGVSNPDATIQVLDEDGKWGKLLDATNYSKAAENRMSGKAAAKRLQKSRAKQKREKRLEKSRQQCREYNLREIAELDVHDQRQVPVAMPVPPPNPIQRFVQRFHETDDRRKPTSPLTFKEQEAYGVDPLREFVDPQSNNNDDGDISDPEIPDAHVVQHYVNDGNNMRCRVERELPGPVQGLQLPGHLPPKPGKIQVPQPMPEGQSPENDSSPRPGAQPHGVRPRPTVVDRRRLCKGTNAAEDADETNITMFVMALIPFLLILMFLFKRFSLPTAKPSVEKDELDQNDLLHNV